MKSCRPQLPKIYIPTPTWSNHHQVFSSLGFPCESFQYYDARTRDVDIESYYSMLRTAEPNSVVILHACAHNPTGCDPTKEQWREISRLMKERQLFPLFDAAYLGFNSGSLEEDAYAIRLFTGEMQMEAAVCVSFAKNMGLYGRARAFPRQSSSTDIKYRREGGLLLGHNANGDNCLTHPIHAGDAPAVGGVKSTGLRCKDCKPNLGQR